MEIVADGVVDKALFALRLPSRLVAEHDIVVPAALHLEALLRPREQRVARHHGCVLLLLRLCPRLLLLALLLQRLLLLDLLQLAEQLRRVLLVILVAVVVAVAVVAVAVVAVGVVAVDVAATFGSATAGSGFLASGAGSAVGSSLRRLPPL